MTTHSDDEVAVPSLEDLATLVRRRRETLPRDGGQVGVSVKTAAGTAGMSPVTWHRVEAGETVRRLSYAGIESALGWVGGSIDRYLAGGPEPEVIDAEADDPTPAPAARVPSLLEATHDELLVELRRRLYHLAPSEPVAEQRRHLASSSEVETAESVAARGGRPGLPMDEGGDASAAGGGQV